MHRHERAFAIRVTTWTHIVAHDFEISALYVALGQIKHFKMQHGDRAEAPASDEDEWGLVCSS